ncbi:DivIVA domain-containing protein [Kribbella lupini]|uniref:DivIVA domain-containing protein n=1 Tax=Kribbella lupini TaxID=291602 RepID=A0ABP4MPB5_9ACTN
MWFFGLVVVVLIGAVAVVASGRWGAMSPAYDDRPDVSVPARQVLSSDDIATTRFAVALRGYRMDEVDGLLERLGREVAERDRRIADLERAVTPILHGPEGAGFTSRADYDLTDFDDTGYQKPILVGGDFPVAEPAAADQPAADQQAAADEQAAAHPEAAAGQQAAVDPQAAAPQPSAAEQASVVEQGAAARQPSAAAEPQSILDARLAAIEARKSAAEPQESAAEPTQTDALPQAGASDPTDTLPPQPEPGLPPEPVLPPEPEPVHPPEPEPVHPPEPEPVRPPEPEPTFPEPEPVLPPDPALPPQPENNRYADAADVPAAPYAAPASQQADPYAAPAADPTQAVPYADPASTTPSAQSTPYAQPTDTLSASPADAPAAVQADDAPADAPGAVQADPYEPPAAVQADPYEAPADGPAQADPHPAPQADPYSTSGEPAGAPGVGAGAYPIRQVDEYSPTLDQLGTQEPVAVPQAEAEPEAWFQHAPPPEDQQAEQLPLDGQPDGGRQAETDADVVEGVWRPATATAAANSGAGEDVPAENGEAGDSSEEAPRGRHSAAPDVVRRPGL